MIITINTIHPKLNTVRDQSSKDDISITSSLVPSLVMRYYANKNNENKCHTSKKLQTVQKPENTWRMQKSPKMHKVMSIVQISPKCGDIQARVMQPRRADCQNYEFFCGILTVTCWFHTTSMCCILTQSSIQRPTSLHWQLHNKLPSARPTTLPLLSTLQYNEHLHVPQRNKIEPLYTSKIQWQLYNENVKIFV